MSGVEDKTEVERLRQANATLQRQLAAAEGIAAKELDAEEDVPVATLVPIVPPENETEGDTSREELVYSEATSCRPVAVQMAMRIMIPILAFDLFLVGVAVAMLAPSPSSTRDLFGLSWQIVPSGIAIFLLIMSVCAFRSYVQNRESYHVSLDRGLFTVGYGYFFQLQTQTHLLRFVKASHYSGSGYPWYGRMIEMDTFSTRGRVFLCREGPTVIVSISSSDYVEFSCEDPQRFEAALNSMIRQQEDLLSRSPLPTLLGSGGTGLSPLGTSSYKFSRFGFHGYVISRPEFDSSGTSSSRFDSSGTSSSRFHSSGTSSSRFHSSGFHSSGTSSSIASSSGASRSGASSSGIGSGSYD